MIDLNQSTAENQKKKERKPKRILIAEPNPFEFYDLDFNDAFGVQIAVSNATGTVPDGAILRATAECFDNPPLRP